MDSKKPFETRVEEFFAGKGFYIVLFLCIAVIGVSAWSLLADAGKKDPEPAGVTVAHMDDAVLPAIGAAGGGGTPISGAVTGAEGEDTTEPAVKIPEDPVPAPAAETVVSAPEPAAAAAVEPVARDYFIWPVAGTVENAYSMTALVFNRTMQDWRTHDGIDIAAELGAQVKACANGRVAEIREDDLYGTTVILSHRDGLVSVYSNLAATPAVAVGDNVGVGQVIGAVGDTALCEAGEVCHLHFAMSLDGESVDPGDYLP